MMNRKEFIQNSSLGVTAFFFLGSGNLFGKAQNPLEHQSIKSTEIINKEVVIIGSGYGGSVAALRLTERNIPVTLLEIGLDWGKSGKRFSAMSKPGHSAAWLKTNKSSDKKALPSGRAFFARIISFFLQR